MIYPPPKNDTITAIATPPGRGGIGVIRISGFEVQSIALALLGFIPKPRIAKYGFFRDSTGETIDEGIVLYFPAPNSFTGEDVLELQGHAGPVVLDRLLKRVLQLGARMARPGEFSERAFLNEKIDLTQAEAIADLIDASSEQAARAAIRSLQGEFSKQIHQVVESLIHLRIYVEATIDFPEEEVDFLSDNQVGETLTEILQRVETIKITAHQGAVLREGMTIVIAGQPNAGKSSLLNALSGSNIAIVTDIPGTTRDVLKNFIHIDDLPLHIIDTAGLRESTDQVEQEGIRRAIAEINEADRVLFVIDGSNNANNTPLHENIRHIISTHKTTIIRNKIDLIGENAKVYQENGTDVITLSAKTGEGIALLREYLKCCTGLTTNLEGNFIARRRHLEALVRAEKVLRNGQQQLISHRASELLAEDLRAAQQILGEITGHFTTEDLLGKIFSSFCIGK